jgi:hypothetical protein
MGEAEFNAFLTHLAVERRLNKPLRSSCPSGKFFLYRRLPDREPVNPPKIKRK